MERRKDKIQILCANMTALRHVAGCGPQKENNDQTIRPFFDLISEAEILVNGIFQDPDQPLMFVTADEVSRLKKDGLIIDVSCDEGMGFSFAKPTSFKEPMFRVESVDYYAVDHTPSYLWESASRSISAALVVHLPDVVMGPEGWKTNETIRRALVIDKGVVKNSSILTFQKRQTQYPHAFLGTQAD